MDDIEPDNVFNPPVILVVSYSEAVKLTDPPIINKSARITRAAFRYYADYRKKTRVRAVNDINLIRIPE